MEHLITLFVVYLLPFTVGQTPNATYLHHLRVGALIQSEGPLLLVEDVVDVKIPLTGLRELEEEQFPRFRMHFSQAETAIARTAAAVGTQNDTTLSEMFAVILFNYKTLQSTFSSIQELSPWTTLLQAPIAHTRPRRGSIDLGGRLLNTLFGVAATDDVKRIQNQMNTWAATLGTQSKVLDGHNKALKALVKSQHLVLTRLNVLTDIMTKIQSQLPTFSHLVLISEKLRAVQFALNSLKQALNMCFKILAEVSSGIVSPDLITPQQLANIIDWAKEEKGLTPLFNKDSIQFYYP